jgi:Kef-type K+ transport system membrane component KefB
VEQGVHALAFGLFVPVFFINIGLSVNARSLEVEMIVFAVVITLTAIIGKWLGSGVGARIGGLSLRESVQLGAGMVSRGEVGLIVAGVGINEGLVSAGEFSAVVAMVLVTTLVTPPILRGLFSQRKHPAPAESPEAQHPSTPQSSQSEEAN